MPGKARRSSIARGGLLPAAVKKRIDYLYPDGTDARALDRYMGEFAALLDAARQSGARVVVVKLPAPDAFRSQLPAEAQFDAALARACAQAGVPLQDFSAALTATRATTSTPTTSTVPGLTAVLQRHLKALLLAGTPRAAGVALRGAKCGAVPHGLTRIIARCAGAS